MRLRHILSAALIAPMALGIIAAEGEAPVELYSACANAGGASVFTIGSDFTGDVETPVGLIFPVTTGDGGTYILDLEGMEVGTRANVSLTLSWDTALTADYDMDVNGQSFAETGDSEVAAMGSAGHCSTFSAETIAWLGNPSDTLHMRVRAS